ncbi:MAG: hypothetical protein JNJ97_05710 [Alphaproteobacteria bacterium]|nr:hypothetical protein [Alphaproteobacteria bacterium]
MAASSIGNTQYSPASQISQLETSRPAASADSGEPSPNEPARPQVGAAAQSITPPPQDSSRGRNVDITA